MRKLSMIAVPAAVVTVAAALAFSGCSKKPAETTAAATEAAAETAAGSEAEAAPQELTGDAKLIAELAPKMPADMGKVTLGDLSTIKITAPNPQEITEKDVDDYITDYVLQGQMKDSDYAIKEGDTANIDFVGKKDGVAFDGGTGSDYDLIIGSGAFIEGFESGLIGAKAGDKVSLNLTFPENYQSEELAGQDVVFEVTVNKVKVPMTVADFTDADANDYSNGTYKTLAEYREGVREALGLSAGAISKGELFTNAITEAVKISSAEPTDAAVDWQIDMYLENYNKQITSNYQFGLAELLTMYGQAYSDFRTGLWEDAKITAGESAVVYEIAKEQGFKYDEASLKQYLEEYGYEEELVRNSSADAWVEDTVIRYLVAKYLIDQAAEVNMVSYEEYEEMLLAQAEEAAKKAEEEGAEAILEAEAEAAEAESEKAN